MEYELTDPEILRTIEDLQAENPVSRIVQMDDTDRAIAKAQRKKLLVFLRGKCRKHGIVMPSTQILVFSRRHDCPDCMGELLKAHEIEP